MRRLIPLVVLAVLAALVATAHEGHVHKLMGTVTAVHAENGHVEMKDTKGAVQSFHVSRDTKIVRGTASASLAELKAGTRVVVEAQTKDGKLVATKVRIGAAGPAH